MANFDEALRYVLNNEGGFSNRHNDKGGPTKFGITKQTAETYFRRHFSVEDIMNLTIESVTPIYKNWYWDGLRLGVLRSQAIATAIFDFNVPAGQANAIHMTIDALKILKKPTSSDRVWTTALQALNSIDPQIFLAAFHVTVSEYFRRCVKEDPTQVANLAGWLNRADKLLTLREVA